ncbi:MAG: CapA family protein, partial [Candidatus Jacksonbacteria bacterium]
VANQKIGMAGFSMVYSQFDVESAQEVIRQLAAETDLIIVNIHWGAEYEHQFNQTQQSIAHKLIDAGADIIIGHHPHVAQGMEIYQNKPIFYSLGNFVFDQYFSPDTQEGLALGVNITDDERHFFLFPIQSHLSQVELMTGKTKQEFLRRFAEWSMADIDYLEEIQNGRMILH